MQSIQWYPKQKAIGNYPAKRVSNSDYFLKGGKDFAALWVGIKNPRLCR